MRESERNEQMYGVITFSDIFSHHQQGHPGTRGGGTTRDQGQETLFIGGQQRQQQLFFFRARQPAHSSLAVEVDTRECCV